jgi:hypothetical protein
VALPPAPEALAPAHWTVSHVRGDVEVCTGGSASVRSNQPVPPALEPGRAIAPGWYRPSLEPVGGSALSTSEIRPVFDHLRYKKFKKT